MFIKKQRCGILAMLTLSIFLLQFSVGSARPSELTQLDSSAADPQITEAQAVLADGAILYPQEGIDTNIIPLAQALADQVASGITVSIQKSSHPNISKSGVITYGSTEAAGSVTFRLRTNRGATKQTLAVVVPAHIGSQELSCTELGMIENDISAGQSNMALLIQAVQDGKEVMVDGVYCLKYVDVQVPLADAIISLTGSTPDAEFILDGTDTSPFFNLADNVDVYISNIKFTQVGPGVRYFLVFASDCLSNQVVIEENTFTGNIRWMHFQGSTTINPATSPFGIKEFYFTQNAVCDVANTFMSLIDMPSDHIVVEDNVINNFDYIFLSNGITNEIAYEEEMFDAKKLMVVRNNRVTCDDDWWGNSANQSYYCFVLFEGMDVIYAGNHIEGLKFSSASGSGAAVYDSYLSCDNLRYTNNVWKNNLNFNSGKENNALLKSKQGGVNKLQRYYAGNSYVIEESYIEMCSAQLAELYSEDPAARLAADLSASWVEMISLTDACSCYYVLNNTFDVYDLRMFSSSVPVEQMHIICNTIKCKKIGGTLLHYSVADNTDYSDKTHIIRDNSIEAEGLSPAKVFRLVWATDLTADGDGQYGNILIENNSILAPCSYLLYEPRASQVSITGNIFHLTDPGASMDPKGISADSFIDDLIYEDNTFI